MRHINALLLASAFIVLLPGQSRAEKIKVGDSLPKAVIDNLNGPGQVDMSSYAGKVVVVDFWASWCEPCKKELPSLNEIYQKNKDKGLMIVGVNVDESLSDAKDFIKHHPVVFPLVYDGKKKQLIEAVGVETMPTSLVLDRSGKVRYIHKGFRDGDSAQFLKEIASIK